MAHCRHCYRNRCLLQARQVHQAAPGPWPSSGPGPWPSPGPGPCARVLCSGRATAAPSMCTCMAPPRPAPLASYAPRLLAQSWPTISTTLPGRQHSLAWACLQPACWPLNHASPGSLAGCQRAVHHRHRERHLQVPVPSWIQQVSAWLLVKAACCCVPGRAKTTQCSSCPDLPRVSPLLPPS